MNFLKTTENISELFEDYRNNNNMMNFASHLSWKMRSKKQ